MTIKLSGILTDGAGVPLVNTDILLRAKRTNDCGVLTTILSTTTTQTGAYSIDVVPNKYGVFLQKEGEPTSYIGDIAIFHYSLPGTLNDYLLLPCDKDQYPGYLQLVKEERERAEKAATNAENSANDALSLANDAINSALDAHESARRAQCAEANASKAKDEAGQYADNAKTSEENAKQSEDNAKTSEVNAKKSEENAKSSEDKVLESENTIKEIEKKVEETESKLKDYEASTEKSVLAAKLSETNAKHSEENARLAEENAAKSALEAKGAQSIASTAADSAKKSENNAKLSETNSRQSEINAKESEENAKKYAEKLELGASTVIEVVQELGDSEESVMSQKAVTESIASRAGLGINQKWKRAEYMKNVKYLNSSNSPICINVRVVTTADSEVIAVYFYEDDSSVSVRIGKGNNNGTYPTLEICGSCIIPSGVTWSIGIAMNGRETSITVHELA